MTTNYSNIQPQHEAAIQVAIANAIPFTLVDCAGRAETFFPWRVTPQVTRPVVRM